MAYHVLNRANGWLRIFKKPDDFHAFERVLEEAKERFRTRICAYALMSNHWHLVLRPEADGECGEGVRSAMRLGPSKLRHDFCAAGRGGEECIAGLILYSV